MSTRFNGQKFTQPQQKLARVHYLCFSQPNLYLRLDCVTLWPKAEVLSVATQAVHCLGWDVSHSYPWSTALYYNERVPIVIVCVLFTPHLQPLVDDLSILQNLMHYLPALLTPMHYLSTLQPLLHCLLYNILCNICLLYNIRSVIYLRTLLHYLPVLQPLMHYFPTIKCLICLQYNHRCISCAF